ncbi:MULTISPECIES: hypothetical protein [Kitasatospora]|uniref:Uncharacterized protein n=1 Tax=Kitasatospora cystarginea TaxID=58350 RepID=A0ABN3EN46_9ACTN
MFVHLGLQGFLEQVPSQLLQQPAITEQLLPPALACSVASPATEATTSDAPVLVLGPMPKASAVSGSDETDPSGTDPIC